MIIARFNFALQYILMYILIDWIKPDNNCDLGTYILYPFNWLNVVIIIRPMLKVFRYY